MRQRIGRRLLSIMLSVLMLISLLPTAVFAEELQNQTTAGVTEQVGEGTGNTVENPTENEDSTGGEETKGESSTPYVAKVGGNEYATLEAAIAAASAGDTVTLLSDVTLTDTLTITKNVTLDLSGKTLTVQTGGDGIVVNNAELTLANSGSSGKYVFDCSASGSDGVYVYNEDANTTSKLIVNSDVEIKVNSNVNSAIHAFGEQGTAVVDISNGKITATGSGKQFHAIHADQNSTINVTGGEFELNVDFESYSEGNDVVGVAIYGNAGKQENIHVNITGGKFTVGGKNAFAQAVQVGMVNGYSKDCTVSISGGEIVLNPTENGTGYVYATYNTSYATAEITGGSVSGTITALVNPYIKDNSIPNDGLTVSGGTFSTEVGAEYLAEGVKQDAKGNIVENYVAKIGTVKYGTLDDAIKAVKNGDTIVVNAGEYKLNGSLTYTGKAFTIKAADGMGVSFDMSAAVALHGAKITFEGVTFDYKTNGNYIGLQHTDTLVYNNCTIKGMVFLYATNETFNSCTFEQTNKDAYNVWTYGAKNVVFNNCTFKCVGKSVLVYNEGTNTKTDLTVKDTEFIASAPVEGKAAIEIDTSLMKDGTTIKVTNTTAKGFADGSNSKSTLWNDKKQTEKTNKNTTVTVNGEEVFAPKIAEVGGVVYPSLEDAFAALSAKDHTLKLLNESVWDAATPVYWVAGTQSGYAAKLTDALTAAYKANAGDITIVCRPDADVGTMTHGHVADNITIYGNNAYLSGGECDLEVDTYMFSRDTGKQVESGGVYLDKNITINAYELDNLGVWGQRHTNHTIDVNLTGCDGKEIAGKENVQRVYISGTTGVNNITLKGCNFLTAKTAVYSNANGAIVVDGCSFTGTAIPVNINHKAGGAVTVEVKNSTFTGCGSVKSGEKQYAAPIRFVNSGSGTMQATVDSCSITGTKGTNGDILIGDGRTGQASNDLSLKVTETTGQVQVQKPGYWITNNRKDPANETHFDVASTATFETSIKRAFITATTGTETDPYTLEQFNEMTRAEYIAAQDRLGGTMYVTVGEYAYATQGVLGNGTADNSDRDSTKLNYYGAPGAKEGQYSDAAVGKSVVFVGDSIENEVEGYTDIDRIGTSLLLAVPAYTNVTFKGIDFYGVFSFNYQLYTSPWSQLGSLNFEGCTFNGLIVGAIAAQTLKFEGCTFNEYSNSASTNNSNPIWVRPAYGNWTKDDNEGQGENFKSLTTIAFTGNTVNSTRPVKFERIAQWEMDTKVTATDNTFNIRNDGSGAKNVGMYFGANAKFDLIVDNNKASSKTAGLYTAVYNAPNGTNYPGLPAGSTVKDANGNNIEKGVPALEWKSTKPLTLKTTEEVAQLTNTKGVMVKFATLEKAIAEAKDGDTVTLLKDCSGNGIKIETRNFANAGLTVDFGGCTYTVGGVLVGSSGTGSNAFQLLEGGKITFRNGTIAGVTEGTKPAEDTPNWHGAPAIVIQNYCDLTLKGMTVSGGDETVYTVSNNHGNVVIEDSTINAGKAKGYTSPAVAFDVCGYDSYDGVSVTVKGSSTINGDIEVSRSSNNTHGVGLALESGTINGKLKIDSSIKNNTATTVTKGGNVTVAAPVGYAWNAEGTLVEAVAQIGENGYVTLADAIAAAEDGNTVKLLKDVTEDVTINKGITLDLGGKTLTHTPKAGEATISVADGVTATVKNGSVVGGTSFYNIQVGTAVNSTANLTLVNVTATAGNTGSSMIDNWGTLTIESGTYTGGLNVVKSEEGSKLTINGGTFTGTYAKGWSYNGVILSAGTTKITGGEFIQNATTPAKSYPSVVLAMKVDGYPSTIEITGGKFINNKSDGKIFYGYGKATSDNFEVSGGTFNKSISDGYCAEGFIPTKNADGTYGVKAGKYVAKVGSKNYETLADAIRLAANGKTVKLLADVNENVEIAANKKLTLDLNGFTLNGGTVEGKAALTNYGTITITGGSEGKTGTIKRDDNGAVGEKSYYVINNKGTMTIESGTVINNSGYRKANSTGSMVGSSLICNGDDDALTPVLNIKGGTFTQNNFIAIKNGALGVLHVSGGTISSDHSAIQNWFKADITGGEIKGLLWTDAFAWDGGTSIGETKIGGNAKFTGEIVMDITGSNVIPKLEINGGELNVTKWNITSDAANAGAKPAISGGTFNAPVKPEYCAANYEPVDNGNGTYGVQHFNVAKIGGKEYPTLQEAFDDVSATGTIELLHDVTVTDTLKYNKDYKDKPTILKMNGYTITGDGCRALQIVNGHLRIEGRSNEDTESIITSTGIENVASSVIRVGADGEKQNLSIANGVTVKTDCSYGITVFGGGTEILSVENSKVISTAKHNADYDGCAIATLGTDTTSASVTIKSGAYIEAKDSNAIYMPSGSLLVYGNVGNYPTVTGLTGIYAKSGRVTIKGANIYGTGVAQEYIYNGNGGVPTGDALVIDNCGYPAGVPTVSFGDTNAPKFESANAKPIGSYATTGNTKVTGFVDKGTFNKAIDKNLLKDGYVCVYNGESNYGVATTENCVAKVGDIYYEALQDAINAANSGDTVELVKDVDLTQTVVVNKTITLDMNGKKLHNTNGIWNDANRDWSLISVRSGDLTITGNGTLDALKDDCYAVDVRDNGKLTIENGKFVGNVSAVYNRGGEVTIKDGDFSIKQLNSNNVQDGYGLLINCYDESYKNGEATITITGGTFQNFDPMNNQAEGKGTSFVAVGVGVDHVDGKFTAKSGMIAQVVDAEGKSVKAFDKLSDALAAVEAKQTVKLLKSVTGEKYVEVEANVTLDLNGYNITDVRLLYVTGQIIDTAVTKGTVKADGYYINRDNEYTPVYDSEKDGYSLFKLSVKTWWYATEKKVQFALDRDMADFSAAVALMNANSNGRRVKAQVEFSWVDSAQNVKGKQAFELGETYMSQYLANASNLAPYVTIKGLETIEGTVSVQVSFVISKDELGNELFTLYGNKGTIKQ